MVAASQGKHLDMAFPALAGVGSIRVFASCYRQIALVLVGAFINI